MFVFRYLPDLSMSKTPKNKVKLLTINKGELKGESYFIGESDQNEDNISTYTIPRGLSTVSFLKLNPMSLEELLSFQNKYGRISSLAWKNNGTEKSFRFSSVPSLQKNSKIIFRNEEADFDTSRAIRKHLAESKAPNYLPISAREVQTSVSNLQNLIKATMKVKEKRGSLFDENYAHYFFEIGNFIIQEKFPSCEVVDNEKQANSKAWLSLMDALVVDQLISLNDTEAYKRCKNCGCIFQYKEGQKRRGAEYCSEFCQEEAKWKRQNERRRTKNKQLRKERDNG